MLHLDHSHTSALSPHTTPNLILSDTPQPDQTSLLSWSAPASTDHESFNFDSNKDQSLAEKPPSPPQSDAPLQQATDADPPPTAIIPPTSAEPNPTEPSPSSPLDPTSPALESTSSLTPPPDSTSPAFPPVQLPALEAPAQSNLEQPDGEQNTKAEDETDEVDKASRASTPLSELSSAPDGDDPPPDVEKKEEQDEKQGDPSTAEASNQVQQPGGEGGEAKSSPEATSEPAKPVEGKLTNGHTEAPPAKSPVATAVTVATHHAPHKSEHIVPKQESISDSDSQVHHLATPEPPTNISTRSSTQVDARVMTVLELNTHLLKVSMEFQARGIRLNDPTFQQYGQRLQSNLAWLAATADAGRKVNHGSMSFPILQPPPAVEFISMDRINQLYSELPTLFQKDLMRRQSLAGVAVPPITGTNGHLKRDRTEEPPGDISNKRRDTGETKMPTPGPGTPSGHRSPSSGIGNLGHAATPPHNLPMQNLPSVSIGSPSMPPPSVQPGMLPSDPQASAANMAARSRMRAGVSDGNRPLSLVGSANQPGAPMQHMAGPSQLANQTQMAGGMNSLSPGMMQSMQILQDPSHPATRYLSAQVPGFTTMPIQQQMQHLQRMQLLMQARKGQSTQHHMANPMQGFSQGSQAGMTAQLGVSNGSPTRIAGQQSPMSPHGSFPYATQTGMDARTANAMNSANMVLDPQRRQLLLMQQQNIMRNNAMFNAQQQQQQQQQRLSQQPGSSPHIGSPMLGGTPDGNAFPTLRSNATVPGIARSTRTPSDHAPSPLTPQLSGRSEDLQRAMMQQTQRTMMHGQSHGMGQMGMTGMNPSWPQGQQQAGPQMSHSQSSYGMTPPGSAGFGSMSAGAPSPAGGQQWSHGSGGQFSFNAGSPPTSQQPHDGNAPGSRQASGTPAPHQQQQQMPQNSPMTDQAGLNVSDFDIFNWGH